MIKELQYKGYTTEPSDYECPDGQLAFSLNLIAEDEQLKPILPPKVKQQIPDGCTLMYIHATSSYRHTIYLREETYQGETFYEVYAIDEEENEIRVGYIHPYKVRSIGNILILLSENSTNYFIFKDGNYKDLGNRLPEINMAFSLKGFPLLYSKFDESKEVKSMTLDSNLFSDNDGNYTTTTLSKENKKIVTENVMAAVNKFIQEETIEKERFLFPFFVRYAYRLYDDSTIMASAPILMTPNTMGQPLVFINDYTLGNKKISIDIMMVTSELQYKFIKSEDFSNWEDIIKSIDIFVSSPIYGYKQDGDIERFVDTNSDYSLYLNQFIGTFTKPVKNEYGEDMYLHKLCYNTNVGDETEDGSPLYSQHSEWEYQWVYGLYFGNKNTASDDNVFIRRPRFVFQLPSLPEGTCFESKIENTYLFYKVATIDPYKQINNDWSKVPIVEDTLKSLVNRESLNLGNDYLSHDRRIIHDGLEYNSRIHSFSSKRECFNGFNAQSMFQYVNSRLSIKHTTRYITVIVDTERGPEPLRVLGNCLDLTFQNPTKYEILTIINEGHKQHVVRSSYDGLLPLAQFCGSTDPNNIDENFKKMSWPSFFYYPNTNAKQMIICNAVEKDGVKEMIPVYKISLKPHEHLNGAFARLDFQSSRPYFDGIEKPEVTNSLVEDGKNKIYSSEVNNPFLFPPSYVTTVGDGEIRGIATAAQPLSQGQFGQFPLYAFTTDGIWSLQVSDTGTFSSRQPISRDVCTDKDSITQLEQSVLFATDRGIMLIEGSKTTAITDSIFSNAPFDISKLPHINALYEHIGHKSDTCLPTQPFRTYMKGCRMAYDYAHQRIYIYNPSYTYAYVFSLKSKMWGMVHHNFAYSINSYPDTQVVTQENQLLSLSGEETNSADGIFVTRPLKLEAANQLKTITELFQRGNFQRGDVATILYGSRDLVHWHVVWSSRDHRISGIHGTPYKYYRIASTAHLSDGQSIFGASINVSPKFGNKLR